MSDVPRRVLVLSGPTSSGKTAVACKVSHVLGELAIINADSKQVYIELPVLTSQSSLGLLYGYLSVFDRCIPSVASWMRDCAVCLEDAWEQGKVPLVVGGTPMYVHSLLHGISILPDLPEGLITELSQERERLGSEFFLDRFVGRCDVDPSCFPRDAYKLVRDVAYFVHTGKTIQQLYQESKIYKIPYDSIEIISIIPADRDFLYSQINDRFAEAVTSGAIEEVGALIQNDEIYKNLAVATICGFREIASYLRSEISFERMLEMGQQSIRNYAKRQLTWFRNKFSEMKTFGNAEDVERYILKKFC